MTAIPAGAADAPAPRATAGTQVPVFAGPLGGTPSLVADGDAEAHFERIRTPTAAHIRLKRRRRVVEPREELIEDDGALGARGPPGQRAVVVEHVVALGRNAAVGVLEVAVGVTVGGSSPSDANSISIRCNISAPAPMRISMSA